MRDGLRLLGAGCFVYLSLMVLVGILGSRGFFQHARSPLFGLGTGLFLLVAVAAALWLFHPKGSNVFGRKNFEEHLRELEELGLLESATFRATRAFEVEEYDDEGIHYFLELEDGRVLCLAGQYLYEYEEITDDPEMNQPRSFPCTEFTIRRHRKEGWVVQMLLGGVVLEPEIKTPTFGKKVWRANAVPRDGEIITGTTYDQLKAKCSVQAQS